MEPDTYEVYAVRYAHHPRRASENFLGGDPHDGPMPIDFFVWAIVSENAGEKRTFVVDTGFNAEMARKRKRELLRTTAVRIHHPDLGGSTARKPQAGNKCDL